MSNDRAMHHYTGLECYKKFKFVFQTLGPAAYHLEYNMRCLLSVENQFFITLVKLRLHYTNYEISLQCGINEAVVGSTISTWINFMYYQWSELKLWPENSLIHYYMPYDFQQKYPTTRVIIDGLEFPIKQPRTPVAQQASFSTYKNRNTLKSVVGITPGGLVSFITPAYGGSATDRALVNDSALVRLLNKNESLMADKGFDIQDLFAPKDVTVNIPTFLRRRNRLSRKAINRDKAIASKRVHVERAIGLAKTYKILTRPLTPSETAIGTQIVFCCFMLCNFRNRIISDNA